MLRNILKMQCVWQPQLQNTVAWEITFSTPLMGRCIYFIIPGEIISMRDVKVWGTNGECPACAAGTYKASTCSAACSACPANNDLSAGSGAITDCICNSNIISPAGSSAITIYVCNAGYSGNLVIENGDVLFDTNSRSVSLNRKEADGEEI